MLFGCCGTYGREGSVSINGVGFVKQNLSTPPLPRAGRRVKGGPTPFGGLDFYIGSQKSSRDMISFSTAQTMNATLHARWSFALVAFLEFLEMHEGVVPSIEEEILPPAFPVISPVPGRPARQLLGDCFQELERKKSGSACPANSPTTSWTSLRRTTFTSWATTANP